MQKSKFTQYGRHFFSIIVLRCFEMICMPSKYIFSDILFHSSSIAVLSETIFWWEVAFVLVSKKPHIVQSKGSRSELKYYILLSSQFSRLTFHSLAGFLLDVEESFLMTVARVVKKPFFCLFFVQSFTPVFPWKLFIGNF